MNAPLSPQQQPHPPLAQLQARIESVNAFVQSKINEAEHALNCRKDMERAWREGTDESWRAVGCKLTKAERLQSSGAHGRIAARNKAELEMFQLLLATIKSLTERNGELETELKNFTEANSSLNRVVPIAGSAFTFSQKPIKYYRCTGCGKEFVQPSGGYEGMCLKCQNPTTPTLHSTSGGEGKF